MKNILLFLLASLARRIITKHKPFVVGITGSVGKTTVRHFIHTFLKEQWQNVYSPPGNYNGEFGLPLSIMQTKSGERNIFSWVRTFWVGCSQLSRTDYPEVLILEYGIDRVGEMDFMCDIVEPDIVVFTTITENHIQNFGSSGAYVHEKLQLARKHHNQNSIVIKNADDDYQGSLRSDFSYGTHARACLHISSVEQSIDGISMHFELDGSCYQVRTKYLGLHNSHTLSPAILVLAKMGYTPQTIIQKITNIPLPPGRGNMLTGKKDAIIIDGTYNGSFLSIQSGVESLYELGEDYTKVALLGDMRELGYLEQETHEKLASYLKTKKDLCIYFVGPLSKKYIQPILSSAHFFLDARQAGKQISETLDAQTIVFAKWSQNTIFLEEGVKELIPNSEHSNLVRQSDIWLHRKESFFKTLH